MATIEDERNERIQQLLRESDERARLERPVNEALYWTEATILQCERVIAIHDWEKNRTDDLTCHTSNRLEELSLLNAAGKAMRWIADAEPDPKWDRTQISSFNDLLTNEVRHVRNKREHDDQYGVGKRDEPIKDALTEEGDLTVKVGANINVRHGDNMLLGGIVDVHKLRDAAIIAATEIRRIQHQQVPLEQFRKKPGMVGPESKI
jgi:hypothetical protein